MQVPCAPGTLSPGNAGYVLATLRRACAGCQNGEFAAMVTAPVHKGVINDAGFPFTVKPQHGKGIVFARLEQRSASGIVHRTLGNRFFCYLADCSRKRGSNMKRGKTAGGAASAAAPAGEAGR